MGRDPLIIILVMRRVQNKRIMGIKGESVQRPASSNWRHYRIAVYGQDTHAAQRRTNCACMNWFRPSLSAKTHCLTYIYIYRRVRRRSVSSPMMIILHIATILFQAFFFFSSLSLTWIARHQIHLGIIFVFTYSSYIYSSFPLLRLLMSNLFGCNMPRRNMRCLSHSTFAYVKFQCMYRRDVAQKD